MTWGWGGGGDLVLLHITNTYSYWGLQNLCTKKAKSKKCKAFLIWHIKWLIIILWALHQWPVNRAWFELFALLGAKILQTPVAISLFSSLGAKIEK